MADVYSWQMALRFSGISASAFVGEIMQTSLRGRAYGAQLPSAGPLPVFTVDTGFEEEDATNYAIEWAHWTPDTGSQTGGLGQATMKEMADKAIAWWDACKAQATVRVELDEIRISAIGANRKTPDGSSNKFILKASRPGTAASNPLPPNLAVAISTRSAARGKRGHGRMFFPWLGTTSISTDGLFGSTGRSALATATASLVRDINAINQLGGVDPNTDVTCSVVSIMRRDYYDISSIQVGDEYDVQNRRRNKRPEIYTTVTV